MFRTIILLAEANRAKIWLNHRGRKEWASVCGILDEESAITLADCGVEEDAFGPAPRVSAWAGVVVRPSTQVGNGREGGRGKVRPSVARSPGGLALRREIAPTHPPPARLLLSAPRGQVRCLESSRLLFQAHPPFPVGSGNSLRSSQE